MANSTSSMSLSRGCSGHNPTSTAAMPSGCSMTKLPMEDEQLAEKRGKLFTGCWQEAEQAINTIISKQHDVVYGNLIKFISSSHKKLQSIYYSAKKSKNQPLMLGIPTAVLLAGVNMPDHDVLFERLKKTIHKSPTPYVVQLNASDCSSGMRATMKRIFVELNNDQVRHR